MKTQSEIAIVYADLIRSGNKNWRGINAAIKKRWSVSGLLRVKRMAWKLVKSKPKHEIS